MIRSFARTETFLDKLLPRVLSIKHLLNDARNNLSRLVYNIVKTTGLVLYIALQFFLLAVVCVRLDNSSLINLMVEDAMLVSFPVIFAVIFVIHCLFDGSLAPSPSAQITGFFFSWQVLMVKTFLLSRLPRSSCYYVTAKLNWF